MMGYKLLKIIFYGLKLKTPMTIKSKALKNIVSEEIKFVAEQENIDVNELIEKIKSGKVVILKNKYHDVKPVGVGEGLKIKVNANIGSSPEHMDIDEEIEKLKMAVKYGADTVMDLSLGHLLKKIRKKVLELSPVPVGTVPIYEVGFMLSVRKKRIEDMEIEDFLKVMEEQAREGVDFMTIHAGLTLKAWEYIKKGGRVIDIVSRGGSMLAVWMEKRKEENPLYTHFDKILEIAHEYDITLSLGDGMRPGSVVDATDKPQIHELVILGELAERAWKAEVQVMIEGPGHVPLNEIFTNIQLEKKLCKGAPFYVLGPLPTDIAAGYDHIAGAVGAALAGYYGADLICYITPAEHLRLPTPEDVKEGVIAAKIAGHIADLAKGRKEAFERNYKLSKARKKLDWEEQFKYVIEPEKARKYREESEAKNKDICTMCGDYCAVKAINEILKDIE